MNLLKMILFEGLLIAAAGITFVTGIWGMIIAAGLVSVISFMTLNMADFWKWEGLLVLGLTIGILGLIGINYQAGKARVMTGLVGGVLSLVMFGAFITPVLALVLWVIVFGTGLIPNISRNKLFWGFASTIWRAILGLGWIILGNCFLS